MPDSGIKLRGKEGLYSSTSIQYIEDKNWKQIQNKIILEIKDTIAGEINIK